MAGSRSVTFPSDRPLGRWWIHRDHEIQAKGDALGDVRIPPGGVLDLEILGDAAADLSPLATLRPDDIHALYIESREFTDASAAHIRGLTSLRVLSLADTTVGDVGVDFLLRRLTQLRSLDLARTRVTDLVIESIGHNTRLESLSLWGTAVTDQGLAKLRGPQLRCLVLHGTRVTGAGMRQVGRLRNLESLDLWDVPISDRDLGHLLKLTELRQLNLWGTRVTARGLTKLEMLHNLKSLVLCGPAVTDAGLAQLSKVKALQTLELHGLTDTGDGVRLPSVTNNGLQYLAALDALTAIEIVGTWVTETGVNDLRAALPACVVRWQPHADIRWFFRT